MKKFIINYKAYREGIDLGAKIATAAGSISKTLGVDIIIAPPFTLLRELSKICKTVAQTVEGIEPGPFTGHISWYEIKNSGAAGVILNHSENRWEDRKKLGLTVELCKKNGLETYVCARDLGETNEILNMAPTAVAYEPSYLIGGDVSVAKAEPGIVKDFVELVLARGGILPLIGAGIKNGGDVRKSIELGADGILVASGVLKAENADKAIRELAEPLSRK